MNEPVLTSEDIAVWDVLWRTAKVHSQLTGHRKAVDRARRITAECLDNCPDACLAWSGGKDSTAMVHLVASLGAQVPVYSEKDDLDYPGEKEYVERWAREWNLDLRVVEPEVSLRQWVCEHAADLEVGKDVHGRSSVLGDIFYQLIENATTKHETVFLGLRAEESRGRRMNRVVRGVAYRKLSGKMVCQPIVDWRGLDVFAYLVSREIEPFEVYRCLSFMHDREPWQLRKSWWIPGAYSQTGGTAWLRRYYPSLFRELCEMIPGYCKET